MAEYRDLARPDPEWLNFPNSLPPGTKHQSMTRVKLPIVYQEGLSIDEIKVPVRDGVLITVRCYRQNSSTDPLPVLVYMHGGGYVTGSLETDDTSCRAVALTLSLLVVSIEYRLAPENKFPTGFEDCHDVLRWICSEEGIERLRIDPTQGLILGGTSAGGNFTMGIAHLVRDEKLTHRLTGLLFLCPSFCHPDARPREYRERILSVDEVNDAPGLTRDLINHFAELYGAPPTDERVSPLLFSSHQNLSKKAVFMICGWDPRRDEALLFADIMREVGIKTKVDVYPGLPHGFWTTCPSLPVSRTFERDLLEGLSWLLE